MFSVPLINRDKAGGDEIDIFSGIPQFSCEKFHIFYLGSPSEEMQNALYTEVFQCSCTVSANNRGPGGEHC